MLFSGVPCLGGQFRQLVGRLNCLRRRRRLPPRHLPATGFRPDSKVPDRARWQGREWVSQLPSELGARALAHQAPVQYESQVTFRGCGLLDSARGRVSSYKAERTP